MRKLLVVGGIVAALAVVAGVALFLSGPRIDVAPFEALREPAISKRADEKVIEVAVAGLPSQSAAKAIPQLFKTYFSLTDARSAGPAAPKARWPIARGIPAEQWTGRFAMKVPQTVATLPSESAGAEPRVALTTWEYGEVAEILHVGAYDAETPTVEKLKAYVAARGYEIVGDHEEEYLKGPGMFFRGDPSGYYTIIRYNVRPKQPAAPDAGGP